MDITLVLGHSYCVSIEVDLKLDGIRFYLTYLVAQELPSIAEHYILWEHPTIDAWK